MKPIRPDHTHAGFTLIEALMTIAILGVMAAIVVSAFSNAGTDAARIIARQQQAAVQSAVNAWVNSDGNRTDVINATTGTGKLHTIAQIQTDYNNAATSLARLNLIASYLDSNTATYLTSSTTDANKISSDSLVKSKQYISMPSWDTGSYPQVTLNPQ
jgi:prepilin-type N-terminal cleavage/methylation domain-containing protein